MFDSFYDLAKNKTICEDFACTNKSFAALSDGCSSGKDTHIGAGLFAKLGPDCISSIFEWGRTVDFIKSFYMLDFENILATLLVIDEAKKEITVSGDGTVVFKNKDHYKIINYSYPQNAPYYLAYRLYPDYEKEYLKQFDNGKKNVTCVTLDESLIVKNWEVYHSHNIIEIVDIKDCSLALAFSDGIESFKKDNGEELCFIDFIREMLKFKNFNGGFLKRRYNAVKKLFNNTGFYNYDDVSGVALITKEISNAKICFR